MQSWEWSGLEKVFHLPLIWHIFKSLTVTMTNLCKNFVPGKVLRVYLDYFFKAHKNHEIVIVINPIRWMPNLRIREIDLSRVTEKVSGKAALTHEESCAYQLAVLLLSTQILRLKVHCPLWVNQRLPWDDLLLYCFWVAYLIGLY